MNDSSKTFATTNIALVRPKKEMSCFRLHPQNKEQRQEGKQSRVENHGYIHTIIKHTSKGGGLHWVTVSTYENPVSGTVKLYDSSLALGVSTSIEMSVSNMLRSPESSISIKLMNSDIQPNTNDCGVYAIAFAVSLAFGKEPAYLHFENSKMRSHLLNCLQSGVQSD